MTAAIPSNEQWSINSNDSDVSAPQKRKRRQRSGGAIEDCFTCRTRATKCDRKRPYCTQCIEIGKDCSGYKTTLTWGVGVASRGKLRGLSCPVANKNVDGSDAQPTEHVEPHSERRRTSPAAIVKQESQMNDVAPSVPSGIPESVAASTTMPLGRLGQTWSHDQTLTRTSGFHDHMQSVESSRSRNLPPDYPISRSLEDTPSEYDSMDLPDSSRSVASYTEQDYRSSMEYSNSSIPLPFYENLPPGTSSVFSEQSIATTSMEDFGVNSTSMDAFLQAMSRDLGYMPDYQAYDESVLPPVDEIAVDPLANPFFNREDPYSLPNREINSSGVGTHNSDTDLHRKDLPFIDSRFSNPFCHISPRLQSWMAYYDRNICPYLVAFDGFDNPYRKNILQLAMDNVGLQNAIAALSTNNLRMRRKELRQFGFADEITDAFRGTPPRDQDEPSAEELRYKQMSIDQLNLQLTNRQAAQDDSVLATLLILCLFHVCDTGFSRFKTQLAGVQKLLALRDPRTQSDFTRWIMVFFTWFDVMTSAVNDREMQIRGDSMAMLDFSSNLGAMEQFSGCDGRLFKLIARLNRLNLLAQGRPVRSQSRNQPTQQPMSTHTTNRHFPRRRKNISKAGTIRSLSAADYRNIDGNGWGTPIASSGDEDTAGWDDESGFVEDNRVEFWAEWHDLRCRLQSFQIDLPNIPSATSPNAPTDPAELEAGQRDMIHINESFRCSALLYTERLGNPSRSSSHHSFQELVSQALYHITALAVGSCVNKFLLWPLFIIGTECVDEGHRDIIRRRCVGVQKESGFYNNISSLEVLEKVWAEANDSAYRSEADEILARRQELEAARSGKHAQAFRWRKAMDRVDGEYIVI